MLSVGTLGITRPMASSALQPSIFWAARLSSVTPPCVALASAQTAMVIAAGNEGQGAEPDNVRTPGDVPRVITVGATDCNDVAAGFSSRGPVTWQNVSQCAFM